MNARIATTLTAALLALVASPGRAASPDGPTAAPASPPPPLARGLDATAAVAYALTHAPALLAQLAQVSSLESTFARLRAGEYPSATAQLQNTIQKSSNLSAGQLGFAPVSNFSQNTAQLQSTYALYNGAQQISSQQAKRQAESARYEFARQQEQTAVSVSNAFYALAAQRGAAVLDENDVRYQRELLDAARAEERVGRIAGVDVLRAEVAVARSESTLVQARTDERNAGEALAVQIGAPAETEFDVPGEVPEPAAPPAAPAALVASALARRPEIAAARASYDAARLADAAVDSDLRPTVQLTGAFGSQVSPTNLVLEQEQIDAANAATLANYQLLKTLVPGGTLPAPVLQPPVVRRQPGFWQFGILSTFQLPLYDYGQRAAAHHAARAQIDAQRASLGNAFASVTADVDAAIRNVAAAAEKLRLAKLSAQLGTESARIAQLQYKNGSISFTDATQIEQTALAAQNDLLAARVAYVTAVVRLRTALAPADLPGAVDVSHP